MNEIIISEIEPIEPTIYYYIYKTTNLITSAFYVGQHYSKTSAFDGYLGSGKYLKRSIYKYGKENFKREILEYCTSANINEKEIYWIVSTSACRNQYPDTLGMNLIIDNGVFRRGENHPLYGKKGELSPMFGKHHSNETRKKMSLIHKGNKMSDETRRKISESKIGKTHSDESKHKMSITKQGSNNPMFGKHHSNESIKKISESKIGKYTGSNHPMFGKHHSNETRKNISESLIGKYTGLINPNNRYTYKLSNEKDYWRYFTDKERHSIAVKFNNNKSNTIIWHGITITRIPK